MIKNDLLTGESFIPTRTTQKFACPENRVKYHNKKASELRRSILYINSPLLKNLRILKDLMIGKKEEKFHRQFLLGKGYFFGVLTHYEKYEDIDIPFVFQFGIKKVEDNYITFIQKKNK